MSARCLSPRTAGTYVLSASRDGTEKVWCAESGACVLTPGREGYREIFSPDGGYIATASLDAVMRLWSAADGACLVAFTDHDGPVRQMVFSPDGTRLASGNEEGVVQIRDISVHSIKVHSSGPTLSSKGMPRTRCRV
ncbi:WD40-repeat-containing domain protein [Ganoderma leucocontextum]|nr:WD40-repeat-containing domain protein [Ganoderma leucocontextum]